MTERTSRLSRHGSPKWVCPLAALLTLGISWSARAQPNDPASQPGYFTKNLYPILEKATCRGCHSVDGVAAATRIHFPEPDAISRGDRGLWPFPGCGGRSTASGEIAAEEQAHVADSPHRRQAYSAGDKRRGCVVDLGCHLEHLSPSETAAALHGISGGDGPLWQVVPVMHRLTHSQYNHTVHDLLGEESNPADQFPPEDFVNGFKGQYQTQDIGPLLADAYSAAAEKLARAAFRAGARTA